MLRYGVILACASVIGIVMISNLNTAEGKGRHFSVEYEGKEYQGIYLIFGDGTLLNVTAKDLSIRTTLQSEYNASLMLIMPEELLNATRNPYYPNGTTFSAPDTDIFEYARLPGVLVDGRSTENYTATTSRGVIEFQIPFEAGIHEIEITGNAIPEFSGTFLAVMALSMGILIITVKYPRWFLYR